MNWSQFIYTKERRQFGRQCLFSDKNELLFSEPPCREYFKEYILRNPVDRGTQLSKQMAWSAVNTDNIPYVSRGMAHSEGGWPKDVNFNDEEQALRYRKKIEREDGWGQQVMGITKPSIRAIYQNTAVNIYQNYFEELEEISPHGDFSARIVNIYRDNEASARPVSRISFAPNELNRFVASYAYKHFSPFNKVDNDFFIWDIENPNKPLKVLKSPEPVTFVEWNNRDEHIIAGGFRNGLVGIWDPRTEGNPTGTSVKEKSHRESVTSLLWVHSKTNSEFFTSSTDGSIYWWDARSLNAPTSTVLLDPERTDNQLRSRAHACSVLEYEYTIPTRFMAGSQQGYIFVGNRKGLTPTEILLSKFKVMAGPIYSLERNPAYAKNFLVIGDWCAKIWTDDCRDSPLIKTESTDVRFMCGTWSQTRCSLFFVGRVDGVLEFRDLILGNDPILKLPITNCPILSVRASEDGQLVAVGSEKGDIFMVEINEGLMFNEKNDRAILAAMFDRETKRNKILEGRIREIKLKIAKDEEVSKQPEGVQDTREEVEEIRVDADQTADDASENIVRESSLEEIENIFDDIIERERKIREQRKYAKITTPFDEIQHPEEKKETEERNAAEDK